MFRTLAISAAALLAAGVFTPAHADQSAVVNEAVPVVNTEVSPETTEAAPKAANSIEHITVIVEDEPVSVRLQRTDLDGVLIEAEPIFTHLKGKVSVEDAVLSLRRYQDGAVMTIDMTDGKVRANDVVLGKLPDWEAREQADTWLSVNAVSVMTGTVAEATEDGSWTFTLDDRLRPKYDLDLWVGGERVSTIDVQPRSIGPVLLVPLEAVTKALGHEIERGPEPGDVTVRRIQDSAELKLNIATGLVTVNGTPRGVSPNMSYADPQTLLLPFTAVETLTGTHIKLVPGTSRIEVTMDDRLGGGALPGERVVDEAAVTPFTAERLEFQLTDRGPVQADFYSRYKGFNTRLRVESVGGFRNPEELQPGWLSLDVRALDGWRANLGDVTPQFRELATVDQSRMRGVAFRRQQESGTILAIAAGVPLTGSQAVSKSASKPTFGGLAAGARLLAEDGNSEIGIGASTSADGSSSRAVIGGQKQFKTDDGLEAGFQDVFVQGDIGVFDDANGTGVDIRGRAEARYRFDERSGIQAAVTHDGARFLAGQTTTQQDADGNFSQVFGADVSARTTGSISADWRAVEDWGVVKYAAGGVRANVTKAGDEMSYGISASANGRLGDDGVDVSMDVSHSSATSASGDEATSQTINLRAFKRFEWGTVQSGYTNVISEGESAQRLVTSVNVKTLRKELGDGASVSFGPSASLLWSPENQSIRGGASVAATSGQKFGDRFRVRGQLSALQSLDANEAGTTLYANVSAHYDITDRIRFEANYNDDFGNGRDLSFGLRGSMIFAEPRKHTRPKDGLGVLKGRVFLDTNRDGIRQPEERGIPGVRVSVRSTRIALRADREGSYTIQNMKTGLYTLMIDRRSLPLGLLVPEDMEPKATIGDGRVTTVDIPVVASGQVRGAVFDDVNNNGELDTGETRIEGARLTLVRVDESEDSQKGIAAGFGQYGFENLSPGDYILKVQDGPRETEKAFTLEEDNLFAVMPIGFASEAAMDGTLPNADVPIEPADIDFEA